MRFKTVKKVAMAGLLLSLLLCLIGVFGVEPGTPESGSMAIWAVVVLMFTMAIVLKWSRCPWCGELIIKSCSASRSAPAVGAISRPARRKRQGRKKINGS